MDDTDLCDYEDQLLEDFSPSQATGPISKFLADMPGTMDSAFAIDAGYPERLAIDDKQDPGEEYLT
jgi:hypothetical protein